MGSTLAILFMIIIIFSVIWYVCELCSVLGIVFGCISCSHSKKYVNTKGLGNFKSIKNYHTAATVFMIISCAILALWFIVRIWFGIASDDYKYNVFDENYYFDLAADFFASSITTLAIHIGSVIAGAIAQAQYKKAKELNEDILSGKVAPPPPPVAPMAVYPANPYQQNGYYQNGYNGQNPYGQQNSYNGQYNNQQYSQQNTYNPNRQGYQQPPQNSAVNGQGYVQPPQSNTCNEQGYVQPPQNSTPANWQTGTSSQFPDPTISPVDAQPGQSGITADSLQNSGASFTKTVVCPNCGEANSDSGKFCTHCGQSLK